MITWISVCSEVDPYIPFAVAAFDMMGGKCEFAAMQQEMAKSAKADLGSGKYRFG